MNDQPTNIYSEYRGDFVQSLARGLSVILAFDADHRELTLSEVSARASLTRATSRRLLLTLTTLGYVRQNGRLFSLRPRVLQLGYSYLSGISIPDIALGHMEALTRDLQESSSISVLDGDEITYVARVPMKRIMTVSISVGTRFPAYATSMGRVMLASLPPVELDEYLDKADLRGITDRTVSDATELRAVLAQVALQGWSIVDQELEDGLRSIAVPLRVGSRVVASINVSTHQSRADRSVLEEQFLPRLIQAASAIEEDYRVRDESNASSNK